MFVEPQQEGRHHAAAGGHRRPQRGELDQRQQPADQVMYYDQQPQHYQPLHLSPEVLQQQRDQLSHEQGRGHDSPLLQSVLLTSRLHREERDRSPQRQFQPPQPVQTSPPDQQHEVSFDDDEEDDEEDEVMHEIDDEDGESPQRASTSTGLVFSERCRICNDPAIQHKHYGGICCFSCRAFFRRTVDQNRAGNASARVHHCRQNNDCDMIGTNRKKCQKCRFAKCIRIGMQPEAVLTTPQRYLRFRKSKKRNSRNQGRAGSPQPGPSGLNNRRAPRSSSRQRRPVSPTSAMGAAALPTSQPASSHTSPSALPYTSPPVRNITSPGHSSPLNLSPAAVNTSPTSAFRAMALQPPHYGRQGPSVPPYGPLDLSPPPALPPLPPYGQPMNPPASPAPLNLSTHTDEEERETLRSSPPQDKSLKPGSDSLTLTEEEICDDDSPAKSVQVFQEPCLRITLEERNTIAAISRGHDELYKSVAFGEDLLREMVCCAANGEPLPPGSAMTAYRLMIQRVTKVAQGFAPFQNLPFQMQNALLKHNADLIVSLRGAVFFEEKKRGLDQILYSFGVDDLPTGRKLLIDSIRARQDHNLGRIDYKNFNSIQRIAENSELEERYNRLMARVGSLVAARPEYVRLLGYIMLFSGDAIDASTPDYVCIQNEQDMLVNMLQRFIYSLYPHPVAVLVFSNLLRCLVDIRELVHIKRLRELKKPSRVPQ